MHDKISSLLVEKMDCHFKTSELSRQNLTQSENVWNFHVKTWLSRRMFENFTSKLDLVGECLKLPPERKNGGKLGKVNTCYSTLHRNEKKRWRYAVESYQVPRNGVIKETAKREPVRHLEMTNWWNSRSGNHLCIVTGVKWCIIAEIKIVWTP